MKVIGSVLLVATLFAGGLDVYPQTRDKNIHANIEISHPIELEIYI